MSNKKICTRDFIMIALINLATAFGFNMMNVGMPIYVTQLGATDFIAGLVISIVTGAALFIRPFTGIILDRYGRKSILLVSVGLMAAVIVAYAVFPVLGIILALRLFHGIGWGLSSTTTSTIVSDIIPNNRFAEGMGYFALTSSIATALGPAMSISLLQSIGIRPVIIIAAIFTILSLVLSMFQHSNEIPKVETKKELHLADFIDKGALLPAGIMFLLTCSFASITTFIALHGQAVGVDNIYLYFMVYAIVTIISRPYIGRMIDKTGFYLPGILSALGVAITMVIISFSTNIIMFSIAGIFAGLGLGAGMGTLQTMAVAAVSSERRGVATSTFFFGFDFGISVGAIIAGALADAIGYANMYLVLAILPVIASLIFIFIGKKRLSAYSQNNLKEVS